MIRMSANEADVREEIAAPLLARLGYAGGSPNDILREYSISYDRFFLGRRKENDPPLRGRPDYILVITGIGRWVLEVKGASVDLDHEVAAQAISYIKHPEVAGAYAAITNGRRFVLYTVAQSSTDKPIVDIAVQSVEQLTDLLRGLLTPSAFARDFRKPIVDLNYPLSEGFRSFAEIVRGELTHRAFDWETNIGFPQLHQSLSQATEVMVGLRSVVSGGRIWRDANSRIRATLRWNPPHDGLLQFMRDKNLEKFEYVCLDNSVSQDASSPSLFEVIGDVGVKEGEQLFDISKWKSTIADIDVNMNFRGQAAGFLKDRIFSGDFEVEYEATIPVMPGYWIIYRSSGDFSVEIDGR